MWISGIHIHGYLHMNCKLKYSFNVTLVYTPILWQYTATYVSWCKGVYLSFILWCFMLTYCFVPLRECNFQFHSCILEWRWAVPRGKLLISCQGQNKPKISKALKAFGITNLKALIFFRPKFAVLIYFICCGLMHWDIILISRWLM